MPCKNVIKEYVAQGFYHLYNRGVEKRLIFLDEQDYGVFLNYLKTYLSPKDSDQLHRQLEFPGLTSKEREDLLQQIRLKNFASEIKLIAYTLMPNHFHFLVQQEAADSITGFMNSLGNRYTMYFNSRHKRVGCLFQGTYKGVL